MTSTNTNAIHDLLSPTTAQGLSRRLHFVVLFGLTFVSLMFYWREEDRLLQVLNTAGQDEGTNITSAGPTHRNPESFWEPMSLQELTRGNSKPNCTWPFVAAENVIAEGDPFEDTFENGTTIRRKIPKVVHLAWVSLNDQTPRQGRCLHYLQVETFEAYRRQFPDYSVYLHDDDAVDALMQQENWPEFPQLNRMMQCMKMRGAMLIDFWRLLVTYRYGGFYADLDLWPTGNFTPETIPPNVDFFSFSDSVRRPTQMAFAMSPGSPFGYTMVNHLLDSVYRIENIYEPPLVFVTGPGVLAQGFAKHYFNWTKGRHPYTERTGIFEDHYGSLALKLPGMELRSNAGLSVNGTKTTYKEQMKKDTGVIHWTWEKDRIKKSHPPISCRHHLFELERRKTRYPAEATAKVIEAHGDKGSVESALEATQ